MQEDYAAFERFNLEYARTQFAYTDGARRTGEATRDMFLAWFVAPLLRPLARPLLYAVMDEPMLRAFGFPEPPRALRTLVAAGLKLRGRLVVGLPRRRRPRLRTALRHRSYPEGYRVAELGPQEPALESPFRHRGRRSAATR